MVARLKGGTDADSTNAHDRERDRERERDRDREVEGDGDNVSRGGLSLDDLTNVHSVQTRGDKSNVSISFPVMPVQTMSGTYDILSHPPRVSLCTPFFVILFLCL